LTRSVIARRRAPKQSRRPRFAVFCSGNGSNFEAILSAVRRGRLAGELALMVCDRPEAFAIRRAARGGIPVAVISSKLFASRGAHEALLIRILKNQKVRFIVLAGYMRIFTPRFIRAFKGRILNIHPSLLPAFKGAHAIRDAYETRVRTTGVSVHVVTEKLDSGRVLAQVKVPVLKSDTLKRLEERIHRAEHRLYPAAVQKFIGGKK
jgi:phosphoribosylglycinamide formyltransferase-1